MTVQPSPEAPPPAAHWAACLREAVAGGWGPTLRAAFLVTAPAAAVLAVAGLFPALCTTIALILFRAWVPRTA